MKKEYAWIKAVCPKCGKRVPDIRAEVGTPEPFTSRYPCCECEHPEDVINWEKSIHDLLVMAAKGEILDAAGNPVPAVTVLQKGGGEYETHRYAVDLFGELYEIETVEMEKA